MISMTQEERDYILDVYDRHYEDISGTIQGLMMSRPLQYKTHVQTLSAIRRAIKPKRVPKK